MTANAVVDAISTVEKIEIKNYIPISLVKFPLF